MKLQYIQKLTLTPTKPFNFNATFFKPDHFTTDDHYYQKGVRWQTMNWGGQKIGLKYEEDVNGGQLYLSIFSTIALDKPYIDSLKEEITYRYNLNLDLEQFYKQGVKNKALATAIETLQGMRPGHPSSLYEYLVIGIILQNASVSRSIQMFRNLLSKFGTELVFDGHKLLCLWDIGSLSSVEEQDLRNLKVGYRAKSLKKIDEQFANGVLNEKILRSKTVEEQRKTLLSLYGVGPATVWYLLFDVFHRWEVFEHISPWEQKLYSQLFFGKPLVSVKKLLSFINKFGAYKHLAVHYLWEKMWWDRFNGITYDWLEKEIRA